MSLKQGLHLSLSFCYFSKWDDLKSFDWLGNYQKGSREEDTLLLAKNTRGKGCLLLEYDPDINANDDLPAGGSGSSTSPLVSVFVFKNPERLVRLVRRGETRINGVITLCKQQRGDGGNKTNPGRRISAATCLTVNARLFHIPFQPPLCSNSLLLSCRWRNLAGRGQFVHFGLSNPLRNTRNLHNRMLVS